MLGAERQGYPGPNPSPGCSQRRGRSRQRSGHSGTEASEKGGLEGHTEAGQPISGGWSFSEVGEGFWEKVALDLDAPGRGGKHGVEKRGKACAKAQGRKTLVHGDQWGQNPSQEQRREVSREVRAASLSQGLGARATGANQRRASSPPSAALCHEDMEKSTALVFAVSKI